MLPGFTRGISQMPGIGGVADAKAPVKKSPWSGMLARWGENMQSAPQSFGNDEFEQILGGIGSGNHHPAGAIMPAAGNPAIPLGMSPDRHADWTRNYAARSPFAGYMARGGRMLPGQWGVVGEEGPEIAKVNPDGTTEVIPMNDPSDPPVQTLGGTQEIPGPNTDPYLHQQSAGVSPQNDPSDPQLQAQIQTLGEVGQAAQRGQLFRDPARFNVQPSGMGAMAPEQQDMGGGPSSGLPQEEAPFDPNAPAPMAVGKYGNSIPEMQRQAGDLERQIELTGQGKDGGPREKSLWKRFGKGLVDAYKNWDGEGGIVGLGASVLGGGIGSAASPQAHQVNKLKTQRGQLFKRLNTAYTMQEQDSKAAYQHSQAAENYNQIAHRNAGAVRQNQQDRAKANEAKIVERNGKVYRQYADGREVLAPEIPSTQVERTLADGVTKGWVDFKEALESNDRQMLAQAQMDMQAGKLNADAYEAYEKQMIDYSKAVNERSEKEVKLIAEANEAFNLSNDATLLPSERNEYRAKYGKLMEQANNLPQPPKPKPPRGDFQAPTIGAKTVSQAELQAIATRTKKTVEEVRKMAEADGYTVR